MITEADIYRFNADLAKIEKKVFKVFTGRDISNPELLSFNSDPTVIMRYKIRSLESKIKALSAQRAAAYQEATECADREWKARVEIRELRQAIQDANFSYYTRHGRFPDDTR